MKKFVFLFVLIFCSSNLVFSADIDSSLNLTSTQKEKLTLIYDDYEKQNKVFDNEINEYIDKIVALKESPDALSSRYNLIIGVYEAKIKSISAEKALLKQQLPENFKVVLTDDQYRLYMTKQINFDELLQKKENINEK